MNKNNQLIAVGIIDGWIQLSTKGYNKRMEAGNDMSKRFVVAADLPNYLRDRNAILGVVTRRVVGPMRDTYANHLSVITQRGRMATIQWTTITAEADEHVEALLRTFKAWE